jgi:hypothetical protein
MYRVQQANFLFHMAFHIQKRKLACCILYNEPTEGLKSRLELAAEIILCLWLKVPLPLHVSAQPPCVLLQGTSVPGCITHEVIITSDGDWLVTDCVMIKNNCRYYAALN